MRALAAILAFLCTVSANKHHKPQLAPSAPIVNVMEGSRAFWNDRAQRFVQSQLNRQPNTNKAKNVVFFLGDGMSGNTVSSTRMYMGKEENDLSFDEFPHYGLAKTYCVDAQVADSACTATAFLSGVKTNFRLLGLNANVRSRQCIIEEADHVESILEWAQKSGKGTGIVTTTRVTHATPAGAFSIAAHREWEHDNALPTACRNLENTTIHDIAYQMVHQNAGKNMKVVLGCGRRSFLNNTMRDEEGRLGHRTDGRNLIDEWVTERSKSGEAKFIWHKQQLEEIDIENTDYLLGLFEDSHCQYQLDIVNNKLQHQEPSLTEMTAKAIRMLQKEKNGYFLLVEGGRIDHAHHANRAQRALEETREFSRAVDVARQMTSEQDTLIVVSSDHSHVVTQNGYPARGNHALGTGGISDNDGMLYETIGYANGPAFASTFTTGTRRRVDISTQDMKNPQRRSSATVPLSSETHAGEDVGVYASGPWSHLFTGNYEQNVIPVAMAYAAQIGPYSRQK